MHKIIYLQNANELTFLSSTNDNIYSTYTDNNSHICGL